MSNGTKPWSSERRLSGLMSPVFFSLTEQKYTGIYCKINRIYYITIHFHTLETSAYITQYTAIVWREVTIKNIALQYFVTFFKKK